MKEFIGTTTLSEAVEIELSNERKKVRVFEIPVRKIVIGMRHNHETDLGSSSRKTFLEGAK